MNEVKQATISVNEAAKLIGCGRITAYQMAKSGRMPVIRFGNRPNLRVPVDALMKWLNDEAMSNVKEEAA
ncbi:MAG: excisionase family DNA-binding protein [Armatimonadetes bacterium]|jgi:excisionase family DNA binding protein|nr:excisionase family DNA-binding protein [Armatimonadota bacterium]